MGCYALVFLTSHSKVKYFPSVLKLFSSARSWGEMLGRDMGLKHCFFFFYFILKQTQVCSSVWPGPQYVAQDGFKVSLCLPQPPKH